MNLTFNTYYEQLIYETGVLKRVSQETAFTEYLVSVENRAAQNPALSASLRKELIQNTMIYQSRMIAAGRMQGCNYMELVYPGMGVPVVAEAMTAPQPAQVPVTPQPAPQPAFTQPQPAPVPQPVQQPVNVQPQPAFVQQQAQPATVPQPATSPQPAVASQPIPQPVPQPVPVTQPQAAPVREKKPGAEYAVGGIVLSVLGTALILTGFVMLAVNFFDNFWQGMSLYLVCGALMLVSELLIRRLVKKLSYVFSGLGIAGFFVVTLINYFVLGLYNFWVTVILLFVFSCLTGVFGYFKKAFLFTVIGYCSVFLGISLIGNTFGDVEYLSLICIMLFQTALWLAMPIEKKYGKAFSIIQIVGNLVLMITACSNNTTGFIFSSYRMNGLWLSIFVSISFIMLLTILFVTGLRFCRYSETGTEEKIRPVAQIVLVAIGTAIYSVFKLVTVQEIYSDLHANIELFVSTLCFVLVGAAFVFFLMRKKIELWQPVIFYVLLMSFFTVLGIKERSVAAAGLTVVLAGSICAARFLKKTSLNVCDLVMKILFSIVAIDIAYNYAYEPGHYIVIAALVAAIAAGSGFLCPSEIILTATLIFAVCQLSSYKLWLILISGVIMLTVFVFHNVKWLRPKVILVYDILAMIAMVFVLGFLNHPFYKNDMITALLVFCFGLATLIQYLQKSYGMFFAGKMMPIAVYLTYFVFILRIKEGFVTSAILMAVALICVALGFLMNQKSVRIYGLVLSLFVCLKLVIFDFASAASLVKTIMYFVVGILALVIAGVYIVSEMMLSRKNQQLLQEQAAAAQNPIVQNPTVQNPTLQNPTVQNPTVQNPTVQNPIVQNPTVQNPAVQNPSVQNAPAQNAVYQDQNNL